MGILINKYMDNHKELEKLYQSIWEGITLTKSLFKEVIIYINDNKITLPPVMKSHLKSLVSMWKHYSNNKDNVNLKFFMDMKDHHSHLNGQLPNEALTKLWDKYLQSGLDFRVKYMKFNHLINQMDNKSKE